MSPLQAKQAAWPWQPIIEAEYRVVREGPSTLGYARLIAQLAVRVILGVSPVIAAMALMVNWGWLPR